MSEWGKSCGEWYVVRGAYKNLQRNSRMARNNKQWGASYAQRESQHASQLNRVDVHPYGYSGVSPTLHKRAELVADLAEIVALNQPANAAGASWSRTEDRCSGRGILDPDL